MQLGNSSNVVYFIKQNACQDATLIIMSGVSIQLLPPCTLPVDGWSPSATVPGTMGQRYGDLFNQKSTG